MNVRGRGQELDMLIRRPIAQVLWFQAESLLIVIVGFLVILALLGVTSFVPQRMGFVGSGRKGNGQDDKQQRRRAKQTSHSVQPSYMHSESTGLKRPSGGRCSLSLGRNFTKAA